VPVSSAAAVIAQLGPNPITYRDADMILNVKNRLGLLLAHDYH